MSRLRATTPVEVDLGPCECPGTPHTDGDKAWLRPRLTAEGGLRATSILVSAVDSSVTYAELGACYIEDGLLRWSLLEDDGKPLEFSRALMQSGRLDWDSVWAPIAEKANEMYTESVLAPLQRGRQPPLPDGQTEGSTSPSLPSTPASPSSPEPSTTSTTPPSPTTGSPTSPDSSS